MAKTPVHRETSTKATQARSVQFYCTTVRGSDEQRFFEDLLGWLLSLVGLDSW